MQLIIVSGLSGSGKSIALQTLEDSGCYCVDNLPLDLLPAFVDSMLTRVTASQTETIAVGVDARNSRENIDHFGDIVDGLRTDSVQVRTLFLTCSDDTLLRRYSETRRRHPLSGNELPLLDAIQGEQRLMSAVADFADLTIDTTRTNVHQLRQLVRKRLFGRRHEAASLLFCSFGYKYGIPTDADFVFDARCLPNPHWEPTLRECTGRDPSVVEFLQQHAEVAQLLDDIRNFVATWLPRFEDNGRSYLTVAVGCTGGQHRSVYLVEALTRHFQNEIPNVTCRHRELE